MKVDTAFCRTCNARDRVIQHNRCIICGNDPRKPTIEAMVTTTDPPNSELLDEFFDQPQRIIVGPTDPLDDWRVGHVDWPTWTWLDRYVLVLCVIGTLYLVVQVARWVL